MAIAVAAGFAINKHERYEDIYVTRQMLFHVEGSSSGTLNKTFKTNVTRGSEINAKVTASYKGIGGEAGCKSSFDCSTENSESITVNLEKKCYIYQDVITGAKIIKTDTTGRIITGILSFGITEAFNKDKRTEFEIRGTVYQSTKPLPHGRRLAIKTAHRS